MPFFVSHPPPHPVLSPVFLAWGGIAAGVFFISGPIMGAVCIGLLGMYSNVRSDPDRLRLVGLLGLLVLILTLNTIAVSYENTIWGELGSEYLRKTSKSRFGEYFQITDQPVTYAVLKLMQMALLRIFDLEPSHFVLPAILLRLYLGTSAGLLVFLIQRNLTRNEPHSMALSLITSFTFASHPYTWFYMNGDQFRNAFGGLFLLAAIYAMSEIREKGWTAIGATFFFIACSFLSHRLYLFVFLVFIFSMFFYHLLRGSGDSRILGLSSRFSLSGPNAELLTLLFFVIFNMVVFIGGYYLLTSYDTPWAGERVFSGLAMDISGFNSKKYLERLAVPGIMLSLVIFVYLVSSYYLFRWLHQPAPFHSRLLFFYVSIIVLAHIWMYSSVSIDLSRLFIVVFPITTILFFLHTHAILVHLLKPEKRKVPKYLFALAAIIFFVFGAKAIRDSHLNSESSVSPSVSLKDIVFSSQSADVPVYLFGQGALQNAQWAFLLKIIFLIFALALFVYFLCARHPRLAWKITCMGLLAAGAPGVASITYGNYEVYTKYHEAMAAARQGNVEAAYTLAGILTRRQGCSDEDAIRWYMAAADQGHVKAQSRLGYLFSSHTTEKLGGMEKNDEKAVGWLNKASLGGDVDAIFLLGLHSLRGLGIYDKKDKKDYSHNYRAPFARQGYELIIRAALQGQPNAQFEIAKLYHEGTPFFPQNLELAHQWYCSANASGLRIAMPFCENWEKHRDLMELKITDGTTESICVFPPAPGHP